MRWWLRNLAIGAGVGLAVGVVVGGTLGRVFMRIVFLAEHDASGFETAMGAIVGEFTRAGTAAIYVFGAAVGVAHGNAPPDDRVYARHDRLHARADRARQP